MKEFQELDFSLEGWRLLLKPGSPFRISKKKFWIKDRIRVSDTLYSQSYSRDKEKKTS
jgi:hypothetical protein